MSYMLHLSEFIETNIFESTARWVKDASHVIRSRSSLDSYLNTGDYELGASSNNSPIT